MRIYSFLFHFAAVTAGIACGGEPFSVGGADSAAGAGGTAIDGGSGGAGALVVARACRTPPGLRDRRAEAVPQARRVQAVAAVPRARAVPQARRVQAVAAVPRAKAAAAVRLGAAVRVPAVLAGAPVHHPSTVRRAPLVRAAGPRVRAEWQAWLVRRAPTPATFRWISPAAGTVREAQVRPRGSGGTSGAAGSSGGTGGFAGSSGGVGGASGSGGSGGVAGSGGIDASSPCSDGPDCLACCEQDSPNGLQRYRETMGECACSFCSPQCAITSCGPLTPTVECIQCIQNSLFVTICGSAKSVCDVNADCKRYSSCSYGCL